MYCTAEPRCANRILMNINIYKNVYVLNAVDFECFIEDEEEEKIKNALVNFVWKGLFYHCWKLKSSTDAKNFYNPLKAQLFILTIFAVSSRQKTVKNDANVKWRKRNFFMSAVLSFLIAASYRNSPNAPKWYMRLHRVILTFVLIFDINAGI